jgi:peptidoglycan/xylan/chitin deacetylase (PgdA/CDA1 family)
MLDLTLSFDNGPDRDTTPGVLDVLARENIHSTFFVLGDKIRSPEGRRLAQRAADEGHWIGNHTMHHKIPLGEASDPIASAHEEIDGTQALLGELLHPDHLFRPFGRGGAIGPHLLSPTALEHLTAGGYTMVLWNSIPRDWAEPDAWVDTALAHCQAQPWTLMVLHDLPTGAMRHLARFIGMAREAGANFRQDFPPDCVPLVRGTMARSMDAYISSTQSAHG